jgi:hypothetical protein
MFRMGRELISSLHPHVLADSEFGASQPGDQWLSISGNSHPSCPGDVYPFFIRLHKGLEMLPIKDPRTMLL